VKTAGGLKSFARAGLSAGYSTTITSACSRCFGACCEAYRTPTGGTPDKR